MSGRNGSSKRGTELIRVKILHFLSKKLKKNLIMKFCIEIIVQYTKIVYLIPNF